MNEISNYISTYFQEAHEILDLLDKKEIEKAVELLLSVKNSGGRLFILGVGGSAANASHAVNDFRKIAGIESYTPTDNVSELTARINDDGWEGALSKWLTTSKLNPKDALMILSVGGGNAEKNISVNLINCLKLAKEVGAKSMGIVGRDGGYTAQVADVCIKIPVVNDTTITPHSEAFQAVVWHLLVTHPIIKENEMKWESTKK